jgi:hypothetical protein
MFNDVSYIRRQTRLWIAFQVILIKMRYRHLRRAWQYATHTLSADDAQTVMLGCRRPAGWYPLTILTVEGALEVATEVFDDHPELPRLIADACAYVDRKWMPSGEELHGTIWWAIEVAEEQAARERIGLRRRDHGTEIVDGDGGEKT